MPTSFVGEIVIPTSFVGDIVIPTSFVGVRPILIVNENERENALFVLVRSIYVLMASETEPENEENISESFFF
jgi:hypothetical protein